MAITDPGAFSVGQKLTAALMNVVRNIALAFLSFSTYTPTLAQGASTNIAKTTNYATYLTLGKLGIVWLKVTASAGGTSGSAITLTLPSSWTVATGSGPTLGGGHYYDASANDIINGSVRAASTTTIDLAPSGVGGGTGVGSGFAVQSGDIYAVFAIVPLT